MSFRDHLEKIRYYRAVCEAGTFRAAADILHASQSSVTVAIGKLEESISQQLLVRTKRGVQPTAAGLLLLEFARDLDHRIDDLEARLRAPGESMAGLLRLGSYDSIAIYWLPPVLAALKQTYPQLSVTISIGSSSKLVDRVRDGELDLAIVAAPSPDTRLDIRTLFHDTFSVYATHTDGHPLISMFRARLSGDETLADTLRNKSVSLTGAMEVESFEIAKALALRSVGAAVLPRRVASFQTDPKILKELPGYPRCFGDHPICIVNSHAARTHVIDVVRDKMVEFTEIEFK